MIRCISGLTPAVRTSGEHAEVGVGTPAANVIATLSIRRARPTNAASATTCRRSSSSTGSSVAASTTSAYSRRTSGAWPTVSTITPHARRRRARPRDDRLATPCRARPRGRRGRRSSAVEVRVAARHREPVGLADERAADDRRPAGRGRRPSAGPPRAAGSPCGRSRRGDGPTIENSLATTVVTPSKCVGRAAPHSPSVSPATCTVVRGGRRVHLVDRRHEQHVDALGLGDARRRRRGRAGTRRGPRSGRTGSGSRTGDTTTRSLRGARGAHERPVPGVEEAHRRHEPDASAAGRGRRRSRADVGDRLDA